MQFEPTPEQLAVINHAVASGRFRTPEEALHDAMAQWLARERARAEIIAALDDAEADMASGNFTRYDKDSLPQMAETLKREARIARNDA